MVFGLSRAILCAVGTIRSLVGQAASGERCSLLATDVEVASSRVLSEHISGPNDAVIQTSGG